MQIAMSSSAKGDTTPLYVRLPAAEAEKLDKAAFALRARKQDLVTGLLARYVDPSSEPGLEDLRELGVAGRSARRSDGTRRVTIETRDDTLTVGRHSFRPAEQPEVLTLSEVAELLRVEPETAHALAERGELPGRRVGDEWRFARRAVLEWLARRED
jgi:excisionase family DNA binding protein